MKFFICLCLIFFTIYRCFWNLEQAPFEQWDEATNIGVLTETISRKSIPVLMYQGKPFFEKPPLWYYMQLISPFSPRSLSAAAGFLTILLTAYIAWKWWGTVAGVTAWIVLLSTNQLFLNNPAGYFSTHTFRSADVDSLFLLCFLLSFYIKRPAWKGVFAGLAVSTKGPLGLLPILFSPTAFGWAIVITIPWYLFMSVTFGWPFLSAHIGYHLAQRVFTPIEGHTNSPWYYVQLLTNRQVFFAWELLAGSIAWLMLKKRWKDARVRSVIAMTVLCFFLPAVARTRLAWYIIPLYPFAALVIAAAVGDFVKQAQQKT